MMLGLSPLQPFPLDVSPRPKVKSVPSKQTTTIESISPVTKTAIAQELSALRFQGHCPLGMYVVPTVDDALQWDCVLFIHQGYYSDAILKFKLVFPPNYPERPPSVHFVTDVFHPLIAQDGRFNFGQRFRPWRPKEHHVFDVLHWVKAAFKKHALDEIRDVDCFNKEAFRLYHNSTASFAALATQTASLSQSDSALYDRDYPSMGGATKHGLLFKRLGPKQLANARSALGLKEWTDDDQ